MTTTVPAQTTSFAADHDVAIPYMQRTRDYYQLLGFSPYRWAHFVDAPFTPLADAARAARVALITTAAPFQPEAGDQGPGAPYNAGAKFYQVYSLPSDDACPISGSRTSATTACTRPRRTSTRICRWRACRRRWRRAASDRSPARSTARRRTGATGDR
jgi:hypothetical protein